MPDRDLEVLWTETAARDLEEIVSYIARDSPTNARRVLSKLRTRAESLTTLPLRGRVFALGPRGGAGVTLRFFSAPK